MGRESTVGYMGKRGSGKHLLGLPLPKFGHQLSLSVSPLADPSADLSDDP